MNRIIRKSFVLAIIGAPVLAAMPHAAFAWPGQGELKEPVGTATLQAFNLQRSGAQAAPAQPMSGEQASLAYERYLKSFAQPIPVFFGSSLKSSGDSGGSGGQQ